MRRWLPSPCSGCGSCSTGLRRSQRRIAYQRSLCAALTAHWSRSEDRIFANRDFAVVRNQGYRWDAYTLGLTYANYSSPNNDDTIDLLSQKNIEATLNAAAGGATNDVSAAGIEQLVGAIPDIYRAGEESSAVTVSLRYDYHPAAALKFEYTQDDVTQKPEDGSGDREFSPSLVRVGVDLMF